MLYIFLFIYSHLIYELYDFCTVGIRLTMEATDAWEDLLSNDFHTEEYVHINNDGGGSSYQQYNDGNVNVNNRDVYFNNNQNSPMHNNHQAIDKNMNDVMNKKNNIYTKKKRHRFHMRLVFNSIHIPLG